MTLIHTYEKKSFDLSHLGSKNTMNTEQIMQDFWVEHLKENSASHCGTFFTNQEGLVLQNLKLVRQLKLKDVVYHINTH